LQQLENKKTTISANRYKSMGYERFGQLQLAKTYESINLGFEGNEYLGFQCERLGLVDMAKPSGQVLDRQ
jgi:hypothetical protein